LYEATRRAAVIDEAVKPAQANDAPARMSDSELLAEYPRSGGDPGDPDVEAILAKIQCRSLDF
jgi:hypothetical protein